MKKFLFPLWIFVAYLLGIIACAWISVEIPSDVGYAGLFEILCVIALLLLLVVPIFCILYSRKVLLHEKRKWLFVPYNAAWITLPCALPLLIMPTTEQLLFCAVLFAWGALWTAVPLLFPAQKQRPILAS